MQNALQALLRRRLLFPVLALGGLLILSVSTSGWAQPRPDSAKADTGQTWISRRNPWAAFGLSCLLPGGGQFYNHEKTKGKIMLGIYLPSVVWFGCTKTYDPNTGAEGYDLAPTLVIISVHIWSMIDAHSSAWRINRKYGYEPPPTKWPPKRNVWVALGLSCLMPGGGQIYNREYLKSGLCVALYAAGAGLSSTGKHPQEDIGTTLMAGGWIGSIVDAPLTASRNNRIRSDYERSMPKIGFIFVPDPRNPRHLQPGLGLRAGF